VCGGRGAEEGGEGVKEGRGGEGIPSLVVLTGILGLWMGMRVGGNWGWEVWLMMELEDRQPVGDALCI